jgi:hypothetical protein
MGENIMEKNTEKIKALSLITFVTLCSLLMVLAIIIAVRENRSSLQGNILTGESTPRPTLSFTPVPTHKKQHNHQEEQYLDEN